MKYIEFETLLDTAILNKTEFANLVEMNYTSVTNWKKSDNVPQWVRSWLENYIKAQAIEKIIEAVAPYLPEKV